MGLFDGTPLERPVVCERCGEPEATCRCDPVAEPELRTPPERQQVRLAIEKRKRGKSVTVVRGLADEGEHLSEVLVALKSSCGAGGTVKEGEIEIQGRQLERVRDVLTQRGYRVTG
jgi:translation initiation factor 1